MAPVAHRLGTTDLLFTRFENGTSMAAALVYRCAKRCSQGKFIVTITKYLYHLTLTLAIYRMPETKSILCTYGQSNSDALSL